MTQMMTKGVIYRIVGNSVAMVIPCKPAWPHSFRPVPLGFGTVTRPSDCVQCNTHKIFILQIVSAKSILFV